MGEPNQDIINNIKSDLIFWLKALLLHKYIAEHKKPIIQQQNTIVSTKFKEF